jgi:CRP-like cAMP-binding protein
MSLLTGDPRTATVVAVTDVECFRLDKASFQRIVERRPEVTKEIATIVAARRAEQEAVREGLTVEAANARKATEETDLLDRMMRFFGLTG